MARLSKEDYIKIYNQYGVSRTWSFSKIECFKQDKYEYFLRYIKKVAGDRKDSAYGDYGTLAHDLIEKYYDGLIEKKDILPEYEKKSLDLEMLGKKFDRTDDKKNENIRNNWEICIKHYLEHIIRPQTDLTTELPIVVQLNSKVVLIGYIDLIEYIGKDCVISDFKTSTIFSAKDMVDKSAQLILYAEAIRQKMNDENFDHIKVQFNFLKYISVEYLQANGEVKQRKLLRSEIGTKLSTVVKTFLKKENYDEQQIADFIQEMEFTNSIDKLPQEIKDKIAMKDCIVPVELSNDIVKEYKEKIIETINEIEKCEYNYAQTQDENIFWDKVDNSKSFYFANLSEYSMDLHKPYKQYLVKNGLLADTLQKQQKIINTLDEGNNMGSIPMCSNIQCNKPIDEKWKDLFGD